MPVQFRMTSWSQAARQALYSGAAASLFSAAVLAVCGKLENDSAAGPVNGPSQWIHGRWAAHVREPSVRHTVIGFIIHHVMATGWALLHEKIFGHRKGEQPFGRRLGAATATAATANFVDYKMTPKRLQPGFETQLSRTSLFLVYAAFAAGLTLYVGAAARRGKARPNK